MKWKALVSASALVFVVGCGEDHSGGGGGKRDTTGGDGDVRADTAPGDVREPDAGDTASGDTSSGDTSSGDMAGDVGDTGDGGTTDDAGMQLQGRLVPLGQYSIGGSYSLTGRIVPGIEGGKQITGGALVVQPVELQPK